jgi:ribosomal RNA-processing protein 9
LTHVRSHTGHIGAVTSLAFAPGAGAGAAAAAAAAGLGSSSSAPSLPCGDLYSGGADGTVKIWSLDDGAYIDSLFGHQAAVLSLAVAKGRPISGGADRTCRLWKVAEETQLIFRAPGQSVDAVCSVGGGGGEWASGGADGALCLWSPLKKRPAARVAAAHAPSRGASPPLSRRLDPVRSWIGAVAAARGGDLVASGAGDGSVRLWAARGGGGGGASSSQRSLEPLGSLPAPGFVNGLALSSDARVLVAGVGPEPRLGRWSKVPSARPALVVQRLRHEVDGDGDGNGDDSDRGDDGDE